MKIEKKWKRSLGTSKRERGVVTPKAPQNRKRIKSYPTIGKRLTSFFVGFIAFINEKVFGATKYKSKKLIKHDNKSLRQKTAYRQGVMSSKLGYLRRRT